MDARTRPGDTVRVERDRAIGGLDRLRITSRAEQLRGIDRPCLGVLRVTREIREVNRGTGRPYRVQAPLPNGRIMGGILERLVIAGNRVPRASESDERVTEIPKRRRIVRGAGQRAFCIRPSSPVLPDGLLGFDGSRNDSKSGLGPRERIGQTPHRRKRLPKGLPQWQRHQVVGKFDWDVGEAQMPRQRDGGNILRPWQEQGPRQIAHPPHEPVVEPQPIHVDQLVARVGQLGACG